MNRNGILAIIDEKGREKERYPVVYGAKVLFEDGARVPLDIAEGDTVIFSKYGGTEVKYGADEYLILSARDVLAVVQR